MSFVKSEFQSFHRLVEQNTDDILNNPEKRDKNKHKSQEDVEETVSKRKCCCSSR